MLIFFTKCPPTFRVSWIIERIRVEIMVRLADSKKGAYPWAPPRGFGIF
jgi:hypothetical protein